MTYIVVKLQNRNVRAIVGTNFAYSFCSSGIIIAIGLQINPEVEVPNATTSDGTPIEFLGRSMVSVELGPWFSGPIPLPVALDCPADILIGNDLIQEINKTHPMKFEFSKNVIHVGGRRVTMLDPKTAEKQFMSIVVANPRTKEEIPYEVWLRGGHPWKIDYSVKRSIENVGNERPDEEISLEDIKAQEIGEEKQKEDQPPVQVPQLPESEDFEVIKKEDIEKAVEDLSSETNSETIENQGNARKENSENHSKELLCEEQELNDNTIKDDGNEEATEE